MRNLTPLCAILFLSALSVSCVEDAQKMDSSADTSLADVGASDGDGQLGDESVAAPLACAQLDFDACIASTACVLDWEPYTYTCRDPEDDCERQSNIQACEDSSSCRWHPASCYCPPGDGCVCQPGPAAMCRKADARVTCIEPSMFVPGNGGCTWDSVCCIPDGEAIGVCNTSQVCP